MGVVVLDAGVIIAVLDADDAHHPAATEALRGCITRRDALVVPASVYAETLVGPERRGTGVVATLQRFYADLGATIEPLTAEIAHTAARLRARFGNRLRLPDALVLATAGHSDASVMTTDTRWPGDLEVEVIVIGET